LPAPEAGSPNTKFEHAVLAPTLRDAHRVSMPYQTVVSVAPMPVSAFHSSATFTHRLPAGAGFDGLSAVCPGTGSSTKQCLVSPLAGSPKDRFEQVPALLIDLDTQRVSAPYQTKAVPLMLKPVGAGHSFATFNQRLPAGAAVDGFNVSAAATAKSVSRAAVAAVSFASAAGAGWFCALSIDPSDADVAPEPPPQPANPTTPLTTKALNRRVSGREVGNAETTVERCMDRVMGSSRDRSRRR
jgi:hypothetical protein